VHLLHNITPFQERDQAKTHFLATISHELKTPLASTDIGLNLLERSPGVPLSEEQHAILSDLRKDHQRLVRIVSELLDMAQVETGRLRVDVRDQGLAAIIREAVGAMNATAAAKHIRIDTRSDPADPLVKVDAEKATWALINLLSNALHFSPEHSIVSVSASTEGDHVQLSVADQGQGLTDDQRAHLFERFAPHAGNGTGLGLSIARDIMRAMGGDIELSATSERGSVFTVRFTMAGTGDAT